MIRNGYKKCTKCLEELYPAERFFHANRSRKDGLSCWCKRCELARCRRWRERNPEKVKKMLRHWREKNRDKNIERVKKWNAENPERRREADRRRLLIPRNNLSNRVSKGMNQCLRNGKGGHHWESLVDYTLDDLMAHLESQFTKGMTWENMGEWHIDHIRPKSDFNFTSPDDSDFKECWSLWNLQPLWAKDNLAKHNKCEAPPLPLLPRTGP